MEKTYFLKFFEQNYPNLPEDCFKEDQKLVRIFSYLYDEYQRNNYSGQAYDFLFDIFAHLFIENTYLKERVEKLEKKIYFM